MNNENIYSVEEVKNSFEKVCSVLDSALANAKIELQAKSVGIRDLSNRSGFDKTGWPFFEWHIRFGKQFTHGSCQAETSVSVKYCESIEKNKPSIVKVLSRAELYREGAVSHFIEDNKEVYIPEDFMELNLGKYVLEKVQNGCNLLKQKTEY